MKNFTNYFKEFLLVRKIIVLFLTLSPALLYAQTEVDNAKAYFSNNAKKYNLSAKDMAEMSISSSYLSPTTGWHHVYFNQTYQSVEVYNGLLNIALKDKDVIHVGNNFVENIESYIPTSSLTVGLSPLGAVLKASENIYSKPNSSASIKEISTTKLPNGQITKVIFQDANLSNENIEVKLYWLPYFIQNGEKTESKVALTWNVKIGTKDFKNIWSVQVDAQTGEVLQKTDEVIHCQFGTPEHLQAPHVCNDESIKSISNKAVVANSYNVFDYPLESPNHGSRTIVTNPYNQFVPAGTGPGATNGWHNDGTTNYTTTRGNNVYAKDDLANDNEITIGSSPSSATLDFNSPYTQATGTAAANLDAAITNLFYWNNVIHDVLWKFGFDEPSGNFQKDNLLRGGNGNDYVNADAQDGSGTNNANFSTPTDGGNPRMQMYIWSNAGSPSYQPDSDFDNGVITHEYGHGWSNRLTGGPANSSCLGNAEQGGEGWSDYLGLMLITNWASLTPTIANANIPKGIGTYVLGQTTTGVGIRNFPYSYDMANVNPTVTYGQVGNTGVFSQPHGIGSIWATMLWDMTWEIILQDNQIVGNIYSTPANIVDMKGNIAALKLVNEGLRLQPCSPSFVQARDAILAANNTLFGGRYTCAIWRAFARRGLGVNASTGASTNDRVVTEDFTPFTDRVLSSATSTTVCSKSLFTYTATTAASGTTTYSWTRPVIAGISNVVGSGNSASISETLINTTNAPITVTYNFVLTPSACPAPQAVKVVVNPTPAITVSSYSICQNGTVPAGQGLIAPKPYSSNISGTITNAATYVRGSGNNVTTYTADRSVYYSTYTFVAPSTSPVTFEITSATLTSGSDTYLSLYQTSFTPASPATNFLHGDDDSGAGLLSLLSHNLVQGNTYILVISTFSTGYTGTYQLQSSSPVFSGVNNWFTVSSGGSAITTGEAFNPVGVAGSGITNTATPGTFTFYLGNTEYPSCRTTTTFTINPTTVGGTVSGSVAVCSATNSGTLTLTGKVGSVVRWESSVNNFTTVTTIANTTTSLNYSNLSQTTKFRAVVQSGSCVAVNSAVATITVAASMSNPTAVSTNKTTVCSGSGVILSATCTSGVITWYNQATGGTALGTGNGFPHIPTVTTTYYAACVISPCFSSRVATSQVTIIPVNQTLTTNITSGTSTYAATQKITATNKIQSPAKVTYRAGKSVSLNTGFEAKSGSVFKAEIQGCVN